MFKKNYAILLILASAFLLFNFVGSTYFSPVTISEVDKACVNSASDVCKQVSADFYSGEMKAGIVFILLGLALISYTLYTATRVGIYHLNIGKESKFSAVAEFLFETDDKVEEYIYHTNKPYAPAYMSLEEAEQTGILSNRSNSIPTKHKFVYQLQHVNGFDTFVRVKRF